MLSIRLSSLFFPYTTLFRSHTALVSGLGHRDDMLVLELLPRPAQQRQARLGRVPLARVLGQRSEEHTSELQSRGHLVCRLLLETKIKSHSRNCYNHNNT